MGKISTNELLENFFTSDDVVGTSVEKQRRVIDKPALYNYERAIGKELIDMDVDDLFGLIKEFGENADGRNITFMTSHRSYDRMTVLLRKIFDFYIETVEPIKNPLYDKRMKGMQAIKRLSEGTEPFRWKNVEDVIEKMHNDMAPDKADYVELLLLMFYCGFEKAEEIVYLKEKMINHKNKTVSLPGRMVRLSDRCYYLLVKFHNQETFDEGRQPYTLAEWQGGYFKFIVRTNQVEEIDDRPAQVLSNSINRLISTNVNIKYKTKINYTILYWLGFYEFMVSRYGEDETYKIITSYRDNDALAKLTSLTSEYGIRETNVTIIKRNLRPFISNSSE